MPDTLDRAAAPAWFAGSLALLLKHQNADGGWPYFPAGESAVESTATAVAALWAHDLEPAPQRRGLAFLRSMQTSAGPLRPQPSQFEPTTLSAMAGVVIARCGDDRPAAARIADGLLKWQPQTVTQKTVFGNDTTLRGFSWVPNTYSWVEPTAYGVLLFDTLRRAAEPRIVEARKLLVDRAVPGGGWNYGNTTVFGTVLESDPLTTAFALLALLDDPSRPAVHKGAEFLRSHMTKIPSPLTLAWSTIALKALGDPAPVAPDDWGPLLAHAYVASESPWHHAAALLALAPRDRQLFIPHGDVK